MLIKHIELDKAKPVVLIDGSYYVFYRYFATLRWFTFQKKDIDIESIIENKEYIDSFIKHINSDIKKICKKWKTNVNNIIFCTDCQRCKIWRNDLYKEYKGTRIQNANFNSRIFNTFNDYIQKHSLKKVFFERLEADDVIYLIQDKLKYSISSSIIIITNDNDYLQLVDKNIVIMNMQFKDISLRGNKNPIINLNYKALYGDKSDNILKITSSLTKDKALALAELNDTDLNKWLIENNLLDKFMFNMHLISFEHIPTEYVKKFYENIIISYI
jgi:5'-3' exonuclease